MSECGPRNVTGNPWPLLVVRVARIANAHGAPWPLYLTAGAPGEAVKEFRKALKL